MGYVMAVRANHGLTVGSGRAGTAAGALSMIPARAWHRMRTGSGTKGTRHYDWAMLEVTSDDTPDEHGDGHSALLVRRHRYTGKVSFYRCWTPEPVPLSRLIAIAVARWRIEHDYRELKTGLGLGHFEGRSYLGWHRHVTLAALAQAFCTKIRQDPKVPAPG